MESAVWLWEKVIKTKFGGGNMKMSRLQWSVHVWTVYSEEGEKG